MTRPIENAPKTAYRPMSVVNQAAARTSVIVTNRTVCGCASGRRRYQPSSGLMTNTRMTTSSTAPARALVNGQSLADARLSTPASMIQAAMSSMPPQASASDPKRVPDRRRSMMIRASMGNAVMASVTPMNAAVTPTRTPGMKIATCPCAAKASPMPATSGTVTPSPLMTDAAAPSPGRR